MTSFEELSERVVANRALGPSIGGRDNTRRRDKMVQTDGELVGRVRLGEVEAFGLLVERYERSVLAIALSRLRDFHKAEDVVQATMLLAFQRRKTLRDDSRFGALLSQIAYSQAAEAARRRS